MKRTKYYVQNKIIETDTCYVRSKYIELRLLKIRNVQIFCNRTK